MICEHCGCFFCDDAADVQIFTGQRSRFCGQTCRKSAKRPAKRRRRTQRARVQRVIAVKLNRSCTQKLRYESAGDAYTALRWLRDDGKTRPGAGIYRCTCGGWHVTSQASWELGATGP